MLFKRLPTPITLKAVVAGRIPYGPQIVIATIPIKYTNQDKNIFFSDDFFLNRLNKKIGAARKYARRNEPCIFTQKKRVI